MVLGYGNDAEAFIIWNDYEKSYFLSLKGIKFIEKCAEGEVVTGSFARLNRRTFLQYSLLYQVAFSIHSTGQIATHFDPPSIPSHSLHLSGSITYISPSLIAD
jgi:hypothetical protein